jgi:hypothetical protein
MQCDRIFAANKLLVDLPGKLLASQLLLAERESYTRLPVSKGSVVDIGSQENLVKVKK